MITKNDILNLENQLYDAMKSSNVEILDKLLQSYNSQPIEAQYRYIRFWKNN